MQLHYDVYPEATSLQASAGQPPVLIIPGLFGSTTNWRSFARKLSLDRTVIVIDQRNHGRSPHADSQSYQDMVNDLLEFAEHHGIQRMIPVGHSMGGKVAMLLALQHPELVEKLIVLDIAPVRYTHSHAPFLEELSRLNLSELGSRAEADRALQRVIPDTPTRLFLLQSLGGKAGDYHWRLNLPVLHQFMPQLMDFPQSMVDSCESDHAALFIRAANSNYVRDQHYPTIYKLFPQAQFSVIADAGHWLHVEQADHVLAAVLEFLNK